jgi:hypothetical protein
MTRTMRQMVHQKFDPLWQEEGITRNEAYRRLATQMGISKRKCHIAMFNIEQCRLALKVLNEKPALEAHRREAPQTSGTDHEDQQQTHEASGAQPAARGQP